MNQVDALSRRLHWPWPALAAWVVAWTVFMVLQGLDRRTAAVAGLLSGLALAWVWPGSGWRKLLIGGGFPLSLWLSGQAGSLPAVSWLVPLALLALVYPLQAWRDAPLFPTPDAALRGLAEATLLGPGARVLDAGCGLGHGMQALRQTMPGARIEGIERSALLSWLARRRCPWARVRQGDMWRLDWSRCDLVYLFQRPESMARAWTKAEAEMAAGAWLASLEFEVPGRRPDAALGNVAGKPVWLYRLGGGSAAQSGDGAADNSTRMPARPDRR